jgi:hypothetical protein
MRSIPPTSTGAVCEASAAVIQKNLLYACVYFEDEQHTNVLLPRFGFEVGGGDFGGVAAGLMRRT